MVQSTFYWISSLEQKSESLLCYVFTGKYNLVVFSKSNQPIMFI